MPRTVHPPEWPDKIMFAALLVVIAGALGAIFALLRVAGLRIDDGLPGLFSLVPPMASLVLALGMVALGVHGIREQAALWVWLAVGAGVVSMEMLGLVPVLSLVAAGFLLRSRAEGEVTRRDAPNLHASLWPDKALSASLLLFVAGLVSLFQAALLFAGAMTPPFFHDAPLVLATLALVAGAAGVVASFEAYRLRHARLGYAAAALNVLGIGFVLIAPALALGAMVFLRKAERENEFEDLTS